MCKYYSQNFGLWERNKENILWITGFSGAGKTYLAEKLGEEQKCLVISLDDFCEPNIEAKAKYKPIIKYLNDNLKDSFFRGEIKDIHYAMVEKIREYIFLNNIKCIIEGIQIYHWGSCGLIDMIGEDAVLVLKKPFLFCLFGRLKRKKTRIEILSRSIKENIASFIEYYKWYKTDIKKIKEIIRCLK